MARFYALPFSAAMVAAALVCAGCRPKAPDAGLPPDAATDTEIAADPPTEAFCNQAMSLLVERQMTCQGFPAQAAKNLILEYGDLGLCKDLAKAVGAKRLKHDESKDQGCLSAIPTAKCNAIGDTFGAGLAAVAQCVEALSGQVALDGACIWDLECPANTYCDFYQSDGTCTGKCNTPEPEGASCTLPIQCAAGLICPASACVAPKISGGCVADEECAAGYTCQGDPGACATAPDGGVATRKKLGDSCTIGAYECQDFTSCSGSAADAGTCTLWPSAGAPCKTNEAGEYVACLGGDCVNGTCVDLLAAGSACTSSSQCSSDDCTDGVCVTDRQSQCSGNLGAKAALVRGQWLRKAKAKAKASSASGLTSPATRGH